MTILRAIPVGSHDLAVSASVDLLAAGSAGRQRSTSVCTLRFDDLSMIVTHAIQVSYAPIERIVQLHTQQRTVAFPQYLQDAARC